MIIGFLFGCGSAYLFKKIDLRHSMFEIATYLLLAYIPSLFSAVRAQKRSIHTMLIRNGWLDWLGK